MALFYGWGSTVSRLQLLRAGSLLFNNKFPEIPTSEGWKAESTLEPPSGFEHGTPGLGTQHLNHKAIALDPNLDLKPLGPTLPQLPALSKNPTTTISGSQ